MAWSYSGDPSASILDAVRFLTGDTNELEPLLQDEEILYLSKDSEDVNRIASKSLGAILITLASQVDYKIGPEEVKASQRFAHFRQVKADLDKSILRGSAYPLGAFTEDKPPVFNLGLFDSDKAVNPDTRGGIKHASTDTKKV